LTSQLAGFGLQGTPEVKTFLRMGSPPALLILLDGEARGAPLDLTAAGLAPLRAQLDLQGQIRTFGVRAFPGIGSALETEFVVEQPDGSEATGYLLAAAHGERTFVMSYIVFHGSGDPATWGALSTGVRFGRSTMLGWLLIGGGAIVGVGALLILLGRLRRPRPVILQRATPSFIRPMLDPHALGASGGSGGAQRPGLTSPIPTGAPRTLPAAPPGLRTPTGIGTGAEAPPARTPPRPGPGMGLRSTLPPSGRHGA
jgi:hypothetical protein